MLNQIFISTEIRTARIRPMNEQKIFFNAACLQIFILLLGPSKMTLSIAALIKMCSSQPSLLAMDKILTTTAALVSH